MLVTHSLTHSLTHSCLVKLIGVTLACEDANSKLVEVVTVADVDAENRVGNSLLQKCCVMNSTLGSVVPLAMFSQYQAL